MGRPLRWGVSLCGCPYCIRSRWYANHPDKVRPGMPQLDWFAFVTDHLDPLEVGYAVMWGEFLQR